MQSFEYFRELVDRELSLIQFNQTYLTVVETGEYDRHGLRRMVILLIYFCEIHKKFHHMPYLSQTLHQLTKEKHLKTMMTEQFAYLISKCHQIYINRTDSPTAPEGMYI